MSRLALVLSCVALLCVTKAKASNIFPLEFGMTPDEVAAALGAPLVYVKGRPGSEIFAAERDAGIPGLYPARERIYLQFRRGGLTGWKKDWAVMQPVWSF